MVLSNLLKGRAGLIGSRVIDVEGLCEGEGVEVGDGIRSIVIVSIGRVDGARSKCKSIIG